MQTHCWSIQPSELETDAVVLDLKAAGDALQNGEVVAFPTETVYGLGANACDESAASKIFRAKGRPSDNPLIVHIADPQDIGNIIAPEQLTPLVQQIIDRFWPGPLSIVFPYDDSLARKNNRKHIISSSVRAGNPSVAIRVPSDPIARQLIRAADCPIAAPSANRSGRPSPTTAAHVAHDLNGLIFGIVDGGAVCHVGVESTVIKLIPASCDSHSFSVRILRPGFITAEMLGEIIDASLISYTVDQPTQAIAPEEAKAKARDFQPECPGTKYRHYSPDKPMHLCSDDEVLKAVVDHCLENSSDTVGVLITEENVHFEHYRQNSRVYVSLAGSREDLSSVARNLFGCLRELDESAAVLLLSERFGENRFAHDQLYLTIMNRLDKAAGYSVVTSLAAFVDLAGNSLRSSERKSLKRPRPNDHNPEIPPAKKVRVDVDPDG